MIEQTHKPEPLGHRDHLARAQEMPSARRTRIRHS